MSGGGGAMSMNDILGSAAGNGQGMGGMAPYMQMMQAPWQSFGQYANAIGGPTILSSGNQSGSSKASAASGGMFGG